MAKIQDKYNSLRAYSQVARPDWLRSVRPEDKILLTPNPKASLLYFPPDRDIFPPSCFYFPRVEILPFVKTTQKVDISKLSHNMDGHELMVTL